MLVDTDHIFIRILFRIQCFIIKLKFNRIADNSPRDNSPCDYSPLTFHRIYNSPHIHYIDLLNHD